MQWGTTIAQLWVLALGMVMQQEHGLAGFCLCPWAGPATKHSSDADGMHTRVSVNKPTADLPK
jgi:hypothetical protein